MIAKIEGEKYNFGILEFHSNILVTVIMNKMSVITKYRIYRCNRSFNLCNHNRAKRGYLERQLDEDRTLGEWENEAVSTMY